MPFKSEAQRRYLWMKHPEVARKWADEEKKGKFTKVAKSYIPGMGWKPATQVGKDVLRTAGMKQNPFGGLFGIDPHRAANGIKTNRYKDMRGRSLGDQAKAESIEGAKKYVERHKLKPYPHINRRQLGGSLNGVTFRQGSKKGGKSYVVVHGNLAGGARKNTTVHEAAHAEPKRSSYRLSQVVSDPAKAAREEARADVKAGFLHTKQVTNRDLAGQIALKDRNVSGYAQSAHVLNKPKQPKESYAHSFVRNQGGAGVINEDNTKAYAQTQDKITGAMRARGKQPRTASQGRGWREPTPARIGIATGAGVGGAKVYNDNRHKSTKAKISKRVMTQYFMDMPNTVVSKSGPDMSEVHVMGSNNKVKGTLKRKNKSHKSMCV